MALNLIKLCVGAESISDLENWIAERRRAAGRTGKPYEHIHTTRMVPSRREELLNAPDGPGSLYWVIKGQVMARHTLLDIRPFTDADGIGRCRIVMQPEVIPVAPRRYRPFQGWRYLTGQDAPQDLARAGADASAMPEALRRELAGLGLL